MFVIKEITAAKPNGVTVYDQSKPGTSSIISPKLSMEVNQAGELQFTLVPIDNFYNTCLPLETFLSVQDDGEEIFYGRVLTRSVPLFGGQISITCEGALNFLLDSELAADSQNSSGTYSHTTQSAEAFIERCLTRHNTEINNDPRRTITKGTINHGKKDTTKKYEITSYSTIKDAITTNVLDEYGGFLRVRKSGSSHVLDWFSAFDRIDAATLEIGKNIIEQTNSFSGENVFTLLRPIGKNGLTFSGTVHSSAPEGTIPIFSPEFLQNDSFGRIIKSVSFSDKEDSASLKTKGLEYAAMLHNRIFSSADVKVVDMYYADGTHPSKIRLGDTFKKVSGFKLANGAYDPMTVAAMEIDLENPGNETLTLKNGKEMESYYSGLSDSSSSSSSGSSSSGGSSGSSGSSSSGTTATMLKYIKEGDKTLQLATEKISINAENLQMTAENYEQLSRRTETLEGKVRTIEGTGVFQNDEHITQVAGKFNVDDNGNVTLVDGAQLTVSDRDGVMMTVGTALGDAVKGVQDYKGSALWTQRDNITAVCGEYSVVTKNGKKYLQINDGTGLQLMDNGTSYGVFHDGNLTGGVIVDMINDDMTETTISGDRINITTNDAFGEISTTVGTHSTDIDNMGNTIDSITGSTIWQNRSTIQNVVGEFEEVKDGNGHTIGLTVKNGGTFRVKKNNVLMAVYDEGNLTAGVIVDKINNGTVTIQASKLNLSGVNFINLINNDNNSVTINANKLDLTGVLMADGLGAAWSALNSASINTLTVGTLNLLNNTGSGQTNLSNALTGYSEVTYSGNTATIKFTTVGGPTVDVPITFSRAITSWNAVWSNGTLTVTASPQNQSYAYVSSMRLNGTAQYSNFSAELLDGSGGGTPQTVKSIYGYLVKTVNGLNSYVDVFDNSSGSGSPVARISVSDVYTAGYTDAGGNAVNYNNGWAAAYSVVSVPTAQSTSDEFVVGFPDSTVDVPDSAHYFVTVDDDYAYLRFANRQGTYVARKANSAYGNGWLAALNGIIWGSQGNTSSVMTISYAANRNATAGSSYKYYRMHLIEDGPNSYITLRDSHASSPSGNQMAKLDVGDFYTSARTAGYNASGLSVDTTNNTINRVASSSVKSYELSTNLSSWSTSNGVATRTAKVKVGSVTNLDTKTMTLTAGAVTWGTGDNANKATVAIKDENDNSVLSVTVNAGDKVTTAVNAFWDNVGLTISSSNHRISRSNNNPVTYYTLSLDTGSWNTSNKRTVKVVLTPSTGNASEWLSTELNAGSIYTQGWKDAIAAITWPSAGTSSNHITIKYKTTPSASASSKAYYVKSLSDKWDSKIRITNSGGSTIYAQASGESLYKSGYQNGWQGYYNDSHWVKDSDSTNGYVQIPAKSKSSWASSGTSSATDWYKPTSEQHSHSGNISLIYEGDAGGDDSSTEGFYGKLYYKSGSSYYSVTSSNRYWYTSGSAGLPYKVYW